MEQARSKNTIKSGTLIQLCILLTAFLILFGATIVNLIQNWMIDDNYSHGFLVPFVAGYMIWQKKDELAKITIKSSYLGLLIIIFGMLVFSFGNISSELFVTRTSIVITIIGLCAYSFGIKVVMALSVPLCYLMFMVPLPSIIWIKIAFPLQLFAAKLTSNVVQFLGIPLLREGNVLHLPNTTLEVVDACSGIRSLVSLLTLSAVFAYIGKIKSISKWFLFLSAIPIAILVNILRLTSTALLARFAGPETAQGFLHDMSGIMVFIVAFIMLFFVYIFLMKVERLVKSQTKKHKNI